ncbi:MAG: glycosyltransferase family 4 protein, partial [Patescibacteria group bacterium]
MKKTLLVTLDYPPSIGGVANYYKNMVDNLNPEKIVILTNQENKLLTRLPIWPKWLPSFINIYKTAKNENIEMILVGQILPLGTVVWLLSKILKTPYIIMTHAMDVTYPLKYPQKKWLIKKILNKAFRVTTVSRFTEKQLKNLMTGRNLAKIETIYPCPNLNISDLNEHKYQELKDKFKSNNEKIILSVGRIVKRKGFDTMIDVVTQLDKEYKNFKYLIIGEGEYKKELLAKTNHHIKFINNVPDNELSAYYK